MKGLFSKFIDSFLWLIGNGKDVNFWLDKWRSPHLDSTYNIPPIFHKHLQVCVADYIEKN